MREVVHVGPYESKGGMSNVIFNLIENSPEGWNSSVIKTHTDNGLWSKILIWLNARKKLKKLIKRGDIDVVHIHVTHSLSWWRKLNFLKLISRHEIPTIIHVHSGKFDIFCSSFFGFPGKSFKKIGLRNNNHVVLLEDRWARKLELWLSKTPTIIRNSTKRIVGQEGIKTDKIKLLMLSRDSEVKGHNFAMEIINCLEKRGISVILTVTGKDKGNYKLLNSESVKFVGWVSDQKRDKLIIDSDFLISPSIFEGSSISIIESMNNGLPCLVSPASYETIGINELVLPLDNADAWAEKIINLFEINEYNKITKEIRKASKRYSSEKIQNEWKTMYERIIQ